MRVLADRAGGLAQLVEGGQVLGEGRLGADLLGAGAFSATGRSSMPLRQPVQRRPDGRAEDVGDLGVASAPRARRWSRCRAGAASPRRPARSPTACAPAARRAARAPRRGGPPGCRPAWPARRRSWRSACPIRRRPRRRARSRRGPWPRSASQNRSTVLGGRHRPARPVHRTPRRTTAVRAPAPAARTVSNTRRLATP